MKIFRAERIFDLKEPHEFSGFVLDLFRYQAENNQVYKDFLFNLGRRKEEVREVTDIPFLPIDFFRNRKVITGKIRIEKIFKSSGTSSSFPGHHYVHDLKLYERNLLKIFSLFYGDPSDYFIAALLPSYNEREDSSLVYMMKCLTGKSRNPSSGFYSDHVSLIRALTEVKSSGQKAILFGVSFALLDLAEQYSPDLSGVIVMETGGMKGRRKEITREELHEILKRKFNVDSIHSEYGMAELMSQAYSEGDGVFYSPPWMKVLIREPYDPLSVFTCPGKIGGINIIDLANLYSCSFIATSDLGKLRAGNGFEVMGRFDYSDIRGCNLLYD